MRLVDPPDPGAIAEVIAFEDLATTERLSVRSPYEPGVCRHKRATIDPVLRIVTCRECKERLDPVEVLIDIARHWRSESARARAIADHEAKERRKDLEKRQRHVQRHMVCDGCGLESRKTVGQLTPADLAAWDQHFAIGHVPERTEARTVLWAGDPQTWIIPAHTHRRRTPQDVARRDLHLAPAGERPPSTGTTFVDRRPPDSPTHPVGRFASPGDQEGG